jgi:hypothetical protein
VQRNCDVTMTRMLISGEKRKRRSQGVEVEQKKNL